MAAHAADKPRRRGATFRKEGITPNGNTITYYVRADGTKHGLETCYQAGTRRKVYELKWKKGKRHGIETVYHMPEHIAPDADSARKEWGDDFDISADHPYSKTTWVKGVRQREESYYPNGTVKTIRTYQGDVTTGFTSYWPSGEIHVNAIYANGMKNGKTTFYREGRIDRVDEYVNNVMCESTTYGADGRVVSVTKYENGNKIDDTPHCPGT